MVTIQFEPFLPYVNLVLKNSYQTGIWLSKIITGQKFEPWGYNDSEGRGGWKLNSVWHKMAIFEDDQADHFRPESCFFYKHPKLFCSFLSNQISLRGHFVFKMNVRISSVTSCKDHWCSFLIKLHCMLENFIFGWIHKSFLFPYESISLAVTKICTKMWFWRF